MLSEFSLCTSLIVYSLCGLDSEPHFIMEPNSLLVN